MCRLFGQIATSPSGVRQWLVDGPRPFVDWSGEHRHGWGIGWYDGPAAKVVKEPLPARDSSDFSHTAENTQSKIVIAHLRKATCGENTVNNSQPFLSHNWLFAHNGTVDREHFVHCLDQGRYSPVGETDSEVYFLWLLQNIENHGVFGLPDALTRIRERPFTALNFVASDGRSLYAYWEQSPSAQPSRSDYYQLYYAKIEEEPRATIVCSEQIGDRVWIPLPHRSLLIVSGAAEPSVIPIG